MPTQILVINPRTYHLIKSPRIYGEGSVVDWYRQVQVVRSKQTTDYGWMHWRSGGGYTDFSQMEVIQTVTLAESQSEFDLDLTPTTTHAAYLVEEAERATLPSLSGWLSPTGELRRCKSYAHDSFAAYILQKDQIDLKQEGWMRLNDAGHSLDQPNEAQASWLIAHRDWE